MTASYLVRTEDIGGETRLQLFTADEKHQVSAQDQLTQYLTSLIELNHYAGTAPLVRCIWQWNPDDTRDLMHMTLIETRPEADSRQDETWTVTPLTGTGEGVMFTVSIDLKGQR